MSQARWTAEDEATFRLLQERRRRATERQRQARAEVVERMREENIEDEERDARSDMDAMEGHDGDENRDDREGGGTADDGEDMFDPNLAALEEGVVLDKETMRRFYRVDGHKARKVGRFKTEAIDYTIVVRPLDALLHHHGANEVV
ncbi:uncharacterized protein LOC135157251 [Lytechinus pictus]|uniref:uncharacterized protein LOC135157251 n=1 Tax=Lytechinus pictus TaxID=7653 RepID=UPI0030B9BB97